MNHPIYEVFDHQQTELLLHLLTAMPSTQGILIIARARESVNQLATQLNQAGFDCEFIHGNKKEALREQTWHRFSDGTTSILVTTDAAVHGRPLPPAKHVVHYDLPERLDDFQAHLASGSALFSLATPAAQKTLAKWEPQLDCQLEPCTASDFAYDRAPIKITSKRRKTPKKGPRSKPLQNKKPKLQPKFGKRP